MYDISHLTSKFANEDLPRLVSYPRTGSHWLRFTLEKYLNEPCLVRSFFVENPKSVWGLHTHDQFSKEQGYKNIIYLYRNPVDVIYSQMVYYKIKFNKENIDKQIKEYKTHLDKWLVNTPEGVENIIRISYEEINNDPINTIKKVLEFLDKPIDEEKIEMSFDSISKSEVKKRTAYSDRVLNTDKGYDDCRDMFKEKFSELISKEFEGIV
jgi:hypothetical protein